MLKEALTKAHMNHALNALIKERSGRMGDKMAMTWTKVHMD